MTAVQSIVHNSTTDELMHTKIGTKHHTCRTHVVTNLHVAATIVRNTDAL